MSSGENLKHDRLRELVRGMCDDWAVSIRKACGAIGFDCSKFHYKSLRADQVAIKKRIISLVLAISEAAIGLGQSRPYP